MNDDFDKRFKEQMKALATYREQQGIEPQDWALLCAATAGHQIALLKQLKMMEPEDADKMVESMKGALEAVANTGNVDVVH